MTRSRGAISKTMLDNYYPHQVMLKKDARYRKQAGEIQRLASGLGAYALGHHFYFTEIQAGYSIYCFPTSDAAETFLQTYGGEWLSPADRKKGNWRPRTALSAKRCFE